MTMKAFHCPICKKAAAKKGNSYFPFCSERCQYVDLGAWLDEKYTIPTLDFSEPEDDDLERGNN